MLANTAKAQTSDINDSAFGVMKYSNGRLYLDGDKLSDASVKKIIGADLWHETYSGARKQYRVGNILIFRIAIFSELLTGIIVID